MWRLQCPWRAWRHVQVPGKHVAGSKRRRQAAAAGAGELTLVLQG